MVLMVIVGLVWLLLGSNVVLCGGGVAVVWCDLGNNNQ